MNFKIDTAAPRGRLRIGILDGLMEGETKSVMKRRAMDRGE